MGSRRLLLDTNCILWTGLRSGRLSRVALQAIEDTSNDLYVSVASIWEIQIKHSKGKLPLPHNADMFASRIILALQAQMLPLQIGHVASLYSLPFHHRDPFDRLLIAQARSEGMVIVSSDGALLDYDVPVLW